MRFRASPPGSSRPSVSALLAVRQLTVRFGGLTALHELSLEVRPARSWA